MKHFTGDNTNVRIVGSSLGRVYSQPAYYALTAAAVLAVVFLYVSLTNVPLLTQAVASGYSITAIVRLMAALVSGISQAAGFATAAALVASAFLAGVNVSMLVYRVRAFGFSSQQGGSAFGGFFMGALGAGCPACATGLLSVLGVTGGLAVLPFDGWELRLLSFILLVLPIYWLSNDIANNGACKIKK